MFEDDTVDIACPSCGHINSLLVRELEESAETHLACESCKVRVVVEAKEFRERLDQVRRELEDMQTEAERETRRKVKRPRKGDFQI